MTNVIYFRVAGSPGVTAPASVHTVCIHCNDETYFLMTQDQYDRWKVKGEFAQNVFPHIDMDVREWMISGTHPDCWKDLFGDEDDYSL
jgi:hypothetical protein